MPDTSSSECNQIGIVHHAHKPIRVETVEPQLKTATSTSLESRTGAHQPSDGKNGTRELLSTDTVLDTRKLHSVTEVLEHVATGLEKLTQKLDGSHSEKNPTGIVHHAQWDTKELLPELVFQVTLKTCTFMSSWIGKNQLIHGWNGTSGLTEDITAVMAKIIFTSGEPYINAVNGLDSFTQKVIDSFSQMEATGDAAHAKSQTEDNTNYLVIHLSIDTNPTLFHGRDISLENMLIEDAYIGKRRRKVLEPLRLVLTGSNKLIQNPDPSPLYFILNGPVHHAISPTQEKEIIIVQHLPKDGWPIEWKDGEHQDTNGIHHTKELLFTDTVRDTRRLPTQWDQSLLVPTGLEKLIRKLDTSSSESNPTGIVHHAHTPIRVTQPTEHKQIPTPESTSITSWTGEHQPTFGRNGTSELLDTDTAQDTKEDSTSSEMSEHADNGLETLIQTLDSSSSENNPTGIVHHAQAPTMDTQPLELLLITTPTSTSTESEVELKDGPEDGREFNKTDTAVDTRNLHSTTDQLMLVADGLDQSTQKPDTSCSDWPETSIVHHAHCITMVQPPELTVTTQLCTSIESLDGPHQNTNGKPVTEELLPTDTVKLISIKLITTEPLLLVPTGLDKLIRKLDSSSSECNPTGIAHHAHTHTMDTQLKELLKTETQESSSSESSTGKHQPTSGRNGIEESKDTDTAQVTRDKT
jgi:hypothetical protein